MKEELRPRWEWLVMYLPEKIMLEAMECCQEYQDHYHTKEADLNYCCKKEDAVDNAFIFSTTKRQGKGWYAVIRKYFN